MISLEPAHFLTEMLNLSFPIDETLGVLRNFFVALAKAFLELCNPIVRELFLLFQLCNMILLLLHSVAEFLGNLALLLNRIFELRELKLRRIPQ